MCFFYLIKEHDGVGFASHGFGELASFFVADVPGRRTDQATDAVFFHVLTHIETRHAAFVVEEDVGQGFGQFGLSDASRAHEDEGRDGAFWVLESGARTTNGVRHGLDRLVLANDAFVHAVFQFEEFFRFTGQHLFDGDASPFGDDCGDVFGADFFAEEGFVRLSVVLHLVGRFFDLLLQVGDFAVAYFCSFIEITLSLCRIEYDAQRV